MRFPGLLQNGLSMKFIPNSNTFHARHSLWPSLSVPKKNVSRNPQEILPTSANGYVYRGASVRSN
jgi:hypothetical protein